MSIEDQLRVVKRLRRDRDKAGKDYRQAGMVVAAMDCEEQAAALKEVEATLEGVKTIALFAKQFSQPQAGGGQ